MAAGVPVVATPVGGVAELVRSRETGTLVPVADPEALATALRHHARFPDRHRALAERALAEVEAFSADRMRTDLARLWRELASSGRAAAGAPMAGEARRGGRPPWRRRAG
jgi:glycosyltransferase involved in cell wall biosynthesis